MSKQTKIILSIIGAAAIIVPLILLITLSSKTKEAPPVSSDTRSIDAGNVEDAARRAIPSPSPQEIPSPSPSTESAQPETVLESPLPTPEGI